MIGQEDPKDFALIVYLKDSTMEDVDNALKRLRKRMDKAGLMEEIYRRQYFLKPCLAKRNKRKKRVDYEERPDRYNT